MFFFFLHVYGVPFKLKIQDGFWGLRAGFEPWTIETAVNITYYTTNQPEISPITLTFHPSIQ